MRLTMDQATIFIAKASDYNTVKRYREFLFDDSEVEDAPCTMRQTSHSSALIASHMVSLFTNHLTNVKMKMDAFVVPFFWEFYIPMNMVSDKPSEDAQDTSSTDS